MRTANRAKSEFLANLRATGDSHAMERIHRQWPTTRRHSPEPRATRLPRPWPRLADSLLRFAQTIFSIFPKSKPGEIGTRHQLVSISRRRPAPPSDDCDRQGEPEKTHRPARSHPTRLPRRVLQGDAEVEQVDVNRARLNALKFTETSKWWLMWTSLKTSKTATSQRGQHACFTSPFAHRDRNRHAKNRQAFSNLRPSQRRQNAVRYVAPVRLRLRSTVASRM